MSPASTQTKRQFSHVRLIIVLTIALNTLDIKTNTSDNAQFTHFQLDLGYCGNCFKSQMESCHLFLPQFLDDGNASVWHKLLTILPQRPCKRNNDFMTIKGTGERVIAKYFANTKEHLTWPVDCGELKKNFLDRARLDGMQFHPPQQIDEFIDSLHLYHKSLPNVTLWLYLSLNVQSLLLPILYEMDFAVPKTHRLCGFTIYQEYAGVDLYNFYNKDLETKLKIAKQLIEASLKFSYGFGNYRLYITDLTADNVVYDTRRERLTFIDLDTVFVVDFREATYKSAIHRHEHIECPGCFAYSPDDITSHNISDINIYTACQFLREDLHRDRTKGFLYPIETEVANNFPGLLEILNRCVDCPADNCRERFSVAKELLYVFDEILDDLNKT